MIFHQLTLTYVSIFLFQGFSRDSTLLHLLPRVGRSDCALRLAGSLSLFPFLGEPRTPRLWRRTGERWMRFCFWQVLFNHKLKT